MNIAVNWPALLIASFASFLGGIGTGLSGFGHGIIFQLFWVLFGNFVAGMGSLKVSLCILLFVQLFTAPPLAYKAIFKEVGSVCSPVLFGLIPTDLIFQFFGNWLVSRVPEQLLQHILGLVFIVMATILYSKEQMFKEESDAKYLKDKDNNNNNNNKSDATAITDDVDDDDKDDEDDENNEKKMKKMKLQKFHMTTGDILATVAISVPPIPPSQEQHSTDDSQIQLVVVENNISTNVENNNKYDDDFNLIKEKPQFTLNYLRRLFTSRSFYGTVLVGSCSGILSGMFGAGGPPIMIYFSVMRFDKYQIRGTSVVWGALVAPIKLAFLIYFGFFSVNDIPFYFVALFSIPGSYTGVKLHQYVNDVDVRMLLCAFIIFGSVFLSHPTTDSILGIIAIIFYVISAIVIICIHLFSYFKKLIHGARQQQQSTSFQQLP